MWIQFNLKGMLFRLKIDNYTSNDESYVSTAYEYEFKDIINYKRYDMEVLLCRNINILKEMVRKLLNNELKEDDFYYCYEPDFNFEFQGDRWLVINTYLWNNEDMTQITDNKISIVLEDKKIEELYNYLKLVTNEIDINNQYIKKMISNNVIYNKTQD